jgi:hypothetical protein
VRKLLLLTLIPLGAWLLPAAAGAPEASNSVTLSTRVPVTAIAADGKRAALLIPGHGRWRVVIWEPAAHRVLPIHTESDADPGGSVALAGTRVAWDDWWGGLTIETRVSSATIAHPAAVSLGSDEGTDGGPGWEVLAPRGDGKLLAFTVQLRCDADGSEPDCPPGRQTGDVVYATIWRAAPSGNCSTSLNDFRRPGHCRRVATARGKLTVLDVDAGRIAARTDDGVRLLTGDGRRLRDFSVRNVSAAGLSGHRIALRVPGAFEIYDTRSGELVEKIPAQGGADRLGDLESGILVTATGKKVTLRRLSDGHTAQFHARGWAHAQLEPSGLFVAGARRVTFTPMANVVRHLR